MTKSGDTGTRMISTRRTVLVLVALALGIATALLGGCGSGTTSGAVSSVAKEATKAISSATAQVKSTTAAAKSDTATTPAETQTVTATSTTPAGTASVTNSKSVKIDATQTTPTTSESGGGGIPWWGWVLIGIGVAGVMVAIFVTGRRHGATRSDAHLGADNGAGGASATSALPPSAAGTQTPPPANAAPAEGE